MPYPYFMPPEYPTSLGLLEVAGGLHSGMVEGGQAAGSGAQQGLQNYLTVEQANRAKSADLLKLYSDLGYEPGMRETLQRGYKVGSSPEMDAAIKGYAERKRKAAAAEAEETATKTAQQKALARYYQTSTWTDAMKQANELAGQGNVGAANSFLQQSYQDIFGVPMPTRAVPAARGVVAAARLGGVPIEQQVPATRQEPIISLQLPSLHGKAGRVEKVGEGQAGYVFDPNRREWVQVISPRAKTATPRRGGDGGKGPAPRGGDSTRKGTFTKNIGGVWKLYDSSGTWIKDLGPAGPPKPKTALDQLLEGAGPPRGRKP